VSPLFWDALDYRFVNIIKGAVAFAAATLLAWEYFRPATSRSSAMPRAAALTALGLVALAGWWNFGRFHFPQYLQLHEHYHYYLGAKYFPELGYTRLYDCVAAVDVEDGLQSEVARRWIRNLATNRLERGFSGADARRRCREAFDPERWTVFKHDIRWFRERSGPDWDIAFIDHGYNATPVWAVAPRLLIDGSPVSENQLLTLSLIDPALLLVMWGVVWWAFGWRGLCVALIWWGTNYPGRFRWTGGALLRSDWLVLSTVGICLLRRQWWAASGAALTAAALLRVFPGVLLVGWLLSVVGGQYRRRSLSLHPHQLRFIAGSAGAASVLVLLSAVVVGGSLRGGTAAWGGFVANSRKHLATPLNNNIGLQTLLSFEPSSRAARLSSYWMDAPWDTWTAARRRVAAERRIIYWLVVGAFILALARAVQHKPEWLGAVLGLTLMPVALNVTCYYYAVFLIFGLVATHEKRTAVALTALAGMSNIVAALWSFDDDIYAATSALMVIFIICVLIWNTQGAAAPSEAVSVANQDAGFLPGR
jgi:hypothetical protein